MALRNLSCHYDELMGFFYNKSGAEDKWDKTQLILVQVVGSVFCCFILVSNAMVIAAVITNKRFHYPFYYLLANLAASDFLAGIAYVYLMFNTGEVSRTLTVKGYFIRQGLLDVSLSASLSNLLVIALERYISVMNWKVHSNLTKRRVTLLIVLVWAISVFMGAVPSLGWNCICNLSDCSQLAPIFSRSYLIFWSVSNLVVFLVMVAIYIRIYLYVKKKTSMLSPHTSGSINRKRTPIKLIKTVMVVLGKCFVPSLLLMFGHFWCGGESGSLSRGICQRRSRPAVHVFSGISRTLEFTESPLKTPDCNLAWLDHKNEKKNQSIKYSGECNNLKPLHFNNCVDY